MLNALAYSERVLEHFERPRNVGVFTPGPDVAVGSAGEPQTGVRFALCARITDARIAEIRFAAYGCPHCIAAGSWLTGRLIAANVADLESWSWREAADALTVPAQKRGRLLILEDAVRALAADWRRQMHVIR
ncbi:MAG TPA: iron-sulfur cluster assembly scaffold protein [Steroidobacter sp.]|jgi:NifU-like protein involved in Fe-S cluster formation|nr:iron-sulfur cluster assembly scaffold protein [Steroidobacter sp.]